MDDCIIRASAAEGLIRAFAATTKNTVETARKIHALSPAATVALGRTLTAAAIMSTFSKGEKDTLTLQIRGDGPLGAIVAVARKGEVRGYVQNPNVETMYYHPQKINLAASVGSKGQLSVIRDVGLKEPYMGLIRLVSGEIAEDLTHYFAYSEQIPTSVALGVLLNPNGETSFVSAAGGMIIQLMPGADEKLVRLLEERIANLPSVSSLLAQNLKPEELLSTVLGDLAFTIHHRDACQYVCNCSKERMAGNLITLGAREIQEILDEIGNAELHCHFCNSYYYFNKEELTEILRKIENNSNSNIDQDREL